MTFGYMSFMASVIIIATAMIRSLAMHKIPKNTFLALWGLALVRLLVPFQFSLPLPFNTPDVLPIMELPVNIMQTRLMSETQEIVLTNAIAIPWFSLVWMVGAIGLSVYFVSIHIRYRRIYKLAVPTENEYINTWQRTNKLKWRTLKIKVSADISAPLTYGLLHPVILMPEATDWKNKEQLQYILLHEMAHVRRFDPLWKLFLLLAACVHWFNPFVWVMYVLANRDLEITCDEKVVCALGKNSKMSYALTLIWLAEKQAKISPLGNAFSKNAAEERIVSIMKINRKSTLAIIIAAIIVMGTGFMFVKKATILTDSSFPDGVKPQNLESAENQNLETHPQEAYNIVETLIAVNRNDENKYTTEQWSDILEKAKKGEILYFETFEEEYKYFYGELSD